MILLGEHAGALGGYSGTDPAVDGAGLARLVARGEARYVVLGGEYSTRGGNARHRGRAAAPAANSAARMAQPVGYPHGLVLFDCAGRERALAAH